MGVSVDGNDERADGLAEGHLYSLLFCVEESWQNAASLAAFFLLAANRGNL